VDGEIHEGCYVEATGKQCAEVRVESVCVSVCVSHLQRTLTNFISSCWVAVQ